MNSPARDAVSPCIGCGSLGRSLLHKTGEEDVLLHRCRSCGLIFNARWASLGGPDIYDYYAERIAWPEERLHDPLNEARYADLLSGFDLSGRKLLDVGCGVGHLVKVARDQGWEAHGIELSAAAVEVCRRFGLSCRVADFLTDQLDPPYDLITMIEVIEHVRNPLEFLQRAGRLLAEGGRVYLTTPNFSALTRRLKQSSWSAIGNEHLSYFTTTSLGEYAERAGLVREQIESRNLSVSELLPGGRGGKDARFAGSPSESKDYSLRLAANEKSGWRIAKNTVNHVLRRVRGGETLVATFGSAGG